MRNRKKKEPAGGTGQKPEPKANETLPEVTEETKDAAIKEVSKPQTASKPSRLKTCVRMLFKIIVALALLAVLAILFMIFVMPRVMSEMEVIFVIYLLIHV